MKNLKVYETQEEWEAATKDPQPDGSPFKPAAEYAPQVLQFFKPTGNMTFLFTQDQVYYTADEIQSTLIAYLQTSGMFSDPIVLNPELTDAIFKGTKKVSRGYPTHLSIDEATELLISRCLQFHAVKLHEDHHQPTIRKGAIREIQIRALKIGGNKKITRVSFLEQFDIVPTDFAKEAQSLCACSVTTQSTVEAGKPTEEVLIQGQFVDEVTAFLTDRLKIPIKYINISYQKGVSKKKKKN